MEKEIIEMVLLEMLEETKRNNVLIEEQNKEIRALKLTKSKTASTLPPYNGATIIPSRVVQVDIFTNVQYEGFGNGLSATVPVEEYKSAFY